MLVPGLPPVERPADPGVHPDPTLRRLLEEDTRRNETTRRLQIHEMLASATPIGPAELTRRVYREVLHADLDDPYLGLSDLLPRD
jgi:hypothetical protein